MILPYLVGFIFYVLSVCLSYSPKLKVSPWYFPIGLAFALIVNYLWLYIAKHSVGDRTIYFNGLYWDAMIVGCYTLIPVIFFGVRFGNWNLLGVILVVVGMILTKV